MPSLPPAVPYEEVSVDDDRPEDALSPEHQAETEVEELARQISKIETNLFIKFTGFFPVLI